MWLWFGFALLIFALVWDYLLKRKRYRTLKSSRIPGPALTWPLIGDVFETIHNDTLSVFVLFERLGKQYGKVVRLWVFHRLFLVVKDPKYLEVILSDQKLIKKSFIYDMFACWLGDGLLLSFSRKWHARRKILTPTYHFKILEQFVEVFDRQSKVLVKKLLPLADGQTAFDVFPIVCLTALDNIAETAMGVKINAQQQPDLPYVKAVKIATEILGARIVKPWQYFDIGFLLTALPSYFELKKNVKILHEFTTKVINDRRATISIQKTETETTSDLDVGQKKRMAFLDVLLQAIDADGKCLSLEDIREEVNTFMFEGHDTTTSGISFCLYLLSRHGAIQQRVFEEIQQILGPNKEHSITMKELQELKYLEAVIKESLRLYPSVPIIGRDILEDVNIGDQIIPGNTNAVLLIYAVGRDADYFPEPNLFNPERYYSEPPDNINPFAYVPFSAGPRNCIGQKFAMLEMKSTISHVIQHFELLPLGLEVKPVLNLILRSQTGAQIGLRRR